MNADLSKENLRARLKKEIIQNNIYGVDIEEGAIEIARLRFWLSLVIELDTPEPLPNFDYKFMQGNSLLESTMLHGTKKPFNLNIQEMLKEKILFPHLKTALKQLHNELNLFYDETDHIKKQASRKAIKEHVIEVLNACVDSEPTKVQEIAEIAAKTKDDFTCTDFFLWHTWFADVFGLDISEDSVAVSNKDGFDIVIGNPPYIGLGGDLNKMYSPYKYVEPKQNAKKKSTVTAVDAVYKFKTHNGNGDIYCLFYEWGRELLKENGHLCYITSNKWMRAGYGEALRDLLAKETNPMILIDFGGVKVFENATVDVNILLFEKTDKNLGLTMCSVGGSDKEVIDAYKIAKRCQDTKDISITEKIQYFLSDYMYRGATVMKFNSSKAWVISSSSIFEQIKTKIEKVGIALGDERWSIRINRGILTGCNDAFVIDTAKRNEILANTADYVPGKALEDYDPQGEYARTAALIRPILRGRDIKRYGYDWAGLWVINTHNGLKQNRKVIVPRVDINDYPAVKAHLDSYKTKLEDRADQGDTPYNLRNCAYINDFDLPKIVYGQFQDDAEYSFAEGGVYLSSNEYMIICPNYSPKCLLAYLNSNAMKWQLENTTGSLGGNTKIGQKSNFVKLRVPILPSAKQKLFDDLVDKILLAKKLNPTADTTSYERQIDALVYLLYGITTYDELLEIEGNPISALQMLILMHIHQQSNSTQTFIQTAYPTIPQSDIQAAISALVNEKVIDYVCDAHFPSEITSDGVQVPSKLYVWFQYRHQYPSEGTKTESFGTIETIDDFATLQQRLVALANDTSSNYVYRGVNNAAYMMYSSAQRNWLDKHTVNTPNDKAEYIEYINSLIKAATPIVRPYLSKYGILCDSCNVCNSYNEIEILALMQHYESVSPFVDFSTCIYTALFFAFDNAECSKAGGLDDYVALYYVSRNGEYLKKDLQNLYQEAANGGQDTLKDKQNEIDCTNCEKIKEELKTWPWDKLSELTHIMVSGNTTTHLEIPAVNFVTENTITSMRQMNQNGLFIANLLPNIPLVELINQVGESNNIFHCIHISKKLKDEVLKWLKGYGIDKQNLYKDKNQDLLKALKDLGKQDI